MIVSHKYKFIFIKTRKTAGTSIEVDLNRMLGPEDIATPIFPVIQGHTPQNYEFKKYFGVVNRKFKNHMSASDVRKLLGDEIWKEYFVFCVEREPVDKTISHFSMLKNSPDFNKGNETLTLEKYIEQGKFPVDTKKYTDKSGKLIVNKILRYENLYEEMKEIAEMLGFSVSLKAKAKSGFRENIALTDQFKQTIYHAFETSNIHTGYKL